MPALRAGGTSCVRFKTRPGPAAGHRRALGEHGRFVAETVDFYYSRSRRGFVGESARLFHQPLEVIERDLTRMTDALEHYLQRQPGRAIEAGDVEAATVPKESSWAGRRIWSGRSCRTWGASG